MPRRARSSRARREQQVLWCRFPNRVHPVADAACLTPTSRWRYATPAPSPCGHTDWVEGGISSDTPAPTRRACIAVSGSTRQRVVYTMGIVVPLVALAIVAALGGESGRRVERAPERRDPRVDFPALGDPRGRTLRRGGAVVTAAAPPPDAGRISADALASAGDRRDRQCPPSCALCPGARQRPCVARGAGRVDRAPILGADPRRLWLRGAAHADPGAAGCQRGCGWMFQGNTERLEFRDGWRGC